ncbi:MAG: hypothetical protein LLG00_10405 [Planctomycetaceae bacterium]|nr:hypothetical protein [Planctomycetaceae bacterium]
MGYDVTDLLENLFGGGPVTVATVPGPEDAGGHRHDDDGDRFADWVPRPGAHGRMGWQAPDLPEVVAFDDLPLPGPACPVCDSLESWQDALGRQRCAVCEAGVLDRAMEWAERAARLRKQAPPRKPAPRIASGCVSSGPVDTLDLDGKRSLHGQLEGVVRA